VNAVVDNIDPTTLQWPDIPVPIGTIVVVGRSSSCSVQLTHASIGRRHTQLAWNGSHLEILDLDSRFGTLVNGVRIRQAMLKPGDTVRIGSSPPYRFDGQRLRVEVDGQGMNIDLHGVSVIRGGAKRLDRINLHIQTGSLVGIIGPSGVGKSLLLGCLSSTIEAAEGQITFDNLPVREHQDYYRSRIGFVTQDDLVDGSLTVNENLYYSAQIRHPDAARPAIRKMVEEGLNAVGLAADHHKLAGHLSGGQRKRLSVAIELLLTPRLLLLDEPTSGLDPHRQANVMDMLRRLSRQGITVVCSTHTLDTLHYLDRVVVLGLKDGVAVVAFDGEPGQLLPAFNVRTTADLFDRLMGVERLSQVPVNTAAPSQASDIDSAPHPGSLEPLSLIPSRKAVTGRHMMRQTLVVLQKSLVGLRRDRVSLLLALVQPAVLAGLVIMSQQNQPRSAFVHFFLVVSAFWLGMTLTVREIVKERKLYVRDRLATLVPNAYFAGKLLYATILVAIQSLILAGIARLLVPWFVGLRHEPVLNSLSQSPLLFDWVILFFVGCGGALIGYLISTLATSERAAVALLPLALLPQVLLSRVAFGDGGQSWGDDSPVGPIASFGKYVAATHPIQELFVLVGSLPMITRPGTAVLDMFATNDWDNWAIEVGYLGVLLLGYLCVTTMAFHWAERRWDSMLR